MQSIIEVPVAPTRTAATWRIDPARSRASFTVGVRLVFVKEATVAGQFPEVTGTIVLDEADPTWSRVALAVAAAGVDTDNARRDKHLRSADFFDVERFPHLSFVGGAVESVGGRGGRFRVAGDLTIRGMTRSIVFDVRHDPPPPFGTDRGARFFATGLLDRRDFGVRWDNPLCRIASEVRVTLVVAATPDDGE